MKMWFEVQGDSFIFLNFNYVLVQLLSQSLSENIM